MNVIIKIFSVKITLFLLKNRKNRSAVGAPPPNSLCLRRLGAMPPDTHISLISLRILCCAT